MPGRALLIVLCALSVLCPAAQGTCNEHVQTPCGVCRSSALLAFQPMLPIGLARGEGRRQGVLTLSAGLRDWLGMGRIGRRKEEWKQAVIEVSIFDPECCVQAHGFFCTPCTTTALHSCLHVLGTSGLRSAACCSKHRACRAQQVAIRNDVLWVFSSFRRQMGKALRTKKNSRRHDCEEGPW